MPLNLSSRRRPSSISSVSSLSSEMSSRLSLKGLLESPLPSPTLPSNVPHHKKNSSASRIRAALRLCLKISLWFFGVSLIIWILFRLLRSTRSRFDVSYLSNDGEVYSLVGDDYPPEEPMPVVVTDKGGKLRWTISLPSSQDFPLKPSTYANICSQSSEVARQVAMNKSHSGLSTHTMHFDYYHVDQSFMDVPEAEENGLLPSSEDAAWSWTSVNESQDKDSMSEDLESMKADGRMRVCERSLTYILETTDAGFGKTLMGLWLSYGLAQKEGRSFFIDDRYWAYGKYSTFFQPPVIPSCLPPPDSHRIPCPHHARHLLISASTVPWAFGNSFEEYFEDPRKVGVLRQGPVFALLRAGYEALFQLAKPDAEYVEKRIQYLNTKTRDEGGLMVGIHVRHGDRHPWEYQYQKSYIPLEKYVDAARDMIISASPAKNGSEDSIQDMISKIVLASDDPDVYSSSELSHALHAQKYILLASKTTLDAAQGTQKPKDKFVEENLGWEGGFYKDVFWGLGDPSSSKTARSISLREDQPEQQGRVIPSDLTLQLRALVGRSYLLDLAVVGKADKVLCGVSSVGCRLLAVMMGWEKGIVQQNWHNVDGDFDWKSIVW